MKATVSGNSRRRASQGPCGILWTMFIDGMLSNGYFPSTVRVVVCSAGTGWDSVRSLPNDYLGQLSIARRAGCLMGKRDLSSWLGMGLECDIETLKAKEQGVRPRYCELRQLATTLMKGVQRSRTPQLTLTNLSDRFRRPTKP